LRRDHGIDARLTIAGDGPERERLQEQVRALELAAHVTLVGRLAAEPLRELLRSGELYVQPSIGMEAFSISALEAACVGLPLALSDQVGLASYLTDHDCALYPARDAAALASLLKKLHERRYDAEWIDVPARRARVTPQFAPEQVAQRVLDLVA
jgi:glycosyltransferase involved in cell wall biosynthesis